MQHVGFGTDGTGQRGHACLLSTQARKKEVCEPEYGLGGAPSSERLKVAARRRSAEGRAHRPSGLALGEWRHSSGPHERFPRPEAVWTQRMRNAPAHLAQRHNPLLLPLARP
ncbi:hypothetical protein GCM10010339_73840 [Streptomyces alanosinicus]|uniref:Uncharacterized protein n=1 Tax=Streptomyces alanosinicus TaxID=68171 RepID=A0A918YQM2_9ACTN|nr:hypothetical protein GCM10010339_73840 [Streptomyces alanosinicus]